jgi:hypothetical protein
MLNVVSSVSNRKKTRRTGRARSAGKFVDEEPADETADETNDSCYGDGGCRLA